MIESGDTFFIEGSGSNTYPGMRIMMGTNPRRMFIVVSIPNSTTLGIRPERFYERWWRLLKRRLKSSRLPKVNS